MIALNCPLPGLQLNCWKHWFDKLNRRKISEGAGDKVTASCHVRATVSTALKGISDRVNTDHVVLWQQGSCGFLHMCHVPGLCG